MATLVAGCFQPLYGPRSPSGGPGVRDQFDAVRVEQISAAPNTSEAYLAVQIRNNLLFAFHGGGSPASSRYKLIVQIAGSRTVTSIDQNTRLPNLERYTLNATYSLSEIATNKVLATGRASTDVSYDTMGTQRFARLSGMHDAERRAAKVISEYITTRLASHFAAGT
jgi:LPS-assembly lipoprotein